MYSIDLLKMLDLWTICCLISIMFFNWYVISCFYHFYYIILVSCQICIQLGKQFQLNSCLKFLLFSCLQTLTRCITAFLVSAVANPYLLIPLFVFLIVLLFIRWYYVQTSRDVKRLEALGPCLYISIHVLIYYNS